MPNAPVTPEIHQSFDAHRNFPTQITFGNSLRDLSAECIKLSVSQVADGHLRTDPGRATYLECTGSAHSINMRQGDPYMLPIRNIDSSNTRHGD